MNGYTVRYFVNAHVVKSRLRKSDTGTPLMGSDIGAAIGGSVDGCPRTIIATVKPNATKSVSIHILFDFSTINDLNVEVSSLQRFYGRNH